MILRPARFVPALPHTACLVSRPLSSMASTPRNPFAPDDMESFWQHLKSSKRIIALCGAGLSASSGLPTFRGSGGLWRKYDAKDLATPDAFQADPTLVWQFYSYRRHMALKAKPNRAHYALAELARRNPNFITLTQNVDGLSQRADHPPDKLLLLHGSLFDVRCTTFYCNYHGTNFSDPIVPALSIPTNDTDLPDISDASTPLPNLSVKDLPSCPSCGKGILRPGVVWFGEPLPGDVIRTVDDFIHSREGVDLIMVIGTSATVYPAAGYVDKARAHGARVAVVNVDAGDRPRGGLRDGDWFFCGDAAELVPEMLREVIGKLPEE